MQFLSLLPYLLMLPTLAIGFCVGWVIRTRLTPKPEAQLSASASPSEDLQKRIQESEANLAETETHLSDLNKNLAAARKRLAMREEEYRALSNQLRERRTDMNEAAAELHRLDEELRAKRDRKEKVLSDFSSRTGELDILTELSVTRQSQIDRLIQHVQWQDGEIARLRQVVKQRSSDVTDIKAILAEREAELDEVIRMRRRVEEDIRAATRHTRQEGGHRDQASPIQIDDLTYLTDLNEAHARRLRESGIINFDQIAQAKPSDLEALISAPGESLPDVRRWIAEAKYLVARDNDDQGPFALPPPPLA